MKKLLSIFLFLAFFIPTLAQTGGQAQETPNIVDTTSRPIERQVKKTFSFETDGVYFSNEFDGARLNNIERTAPNSYTITITPENAPVNMSPWYAFRVWSQKKKEIFV